MTKNSFLGVPYEMAPIVTPSTPALRPVVDKVDTQLYSEEQQIIAIGRREYRSDAQVLTVQNPVVAAATFRNNPGVSVTPAGRSEALRRRRVEMAMMADAPVLPRAAPLVTSPELVDAASTRDRVGPLDDPSGLRSIVPVMRKRA
jgi:hypothetical protein